MSIQPIKLWGHWGAPNPWKVCMVLEALSLPYDIHFIELNEVKNENHVKLNPNGRLPTMEDPNTGLVLWEVGEPFENDEAVRCVGCYADGGEQSAAIIQYLVDQYDGERKISYESVPEKYLTQQWLAFQISGTSFLTPDSSVGRPLTPSRRPRTLLRPSNVVRALPPRKAPKRNRALR